MLLALVEAAGLLKFLTVVIVSIRSITYGLLVDVLLIGILVNLGFPLCKVY